MKHTSNWSGYACFDTRFETCEVLKAEYGHSYTFFVLDRQNVLEKARATDWVGGIFLCCWNTTLALTVLQDKRRPHKGRMALSHFVSLSCALLIGWILEETKTLDSSSISFGKIVIEP